MISKQKKTFFKLIWHLIAILLIGLTSFVSLLAVNGIENKAGSNAIHLENVTSLHLLQQNEHKQFPGVPANQCSSEYVESEEENKEEGGGNDYCNRVYQFTLPFGLYGKNNVNYSFDISVVGKQLPLFLLFHCWKSFLA